MMRQVGERVLTQYRSNPIAIPPSFLDATVLPADSRPVTVTAVDFANSPLPEYAPAFAAVLDNVLSPSECAEMLRLAEASVLEADYGTPPSAADSTAGDPWQPARVNVGAGLEVLMPDYRRGERIIWDSQEVVDRLWRRIEQQAPGLFDDAVVKGGPLLRGFREDELYGGRRYGSTKKVAEWTFARVNQRMRFLRYGKGGFFKPHCDGAYGETGDGGEVRRTWFTLQLYFNDAVSTAEREGDGEKEEGDTKGSTEDGKHKSADDGDASGAATADLVGGATEFLSSDGTRKLAVECRAGRVLIFQHARLNHCGAEVVAGTKYTVRSDVLYELKREGGGGVETK